MKNIRDTINRMPQTRSELEDKVLSYSPELKEKIERDPSLRGRFDKIADEQFEKYRPYVEGGLTHKLSKAGHTVGYAADAWALTGDIATSLGGKFINLLAQVPEKLYKSISYAVRTGNYLDAASNIVRGAISYLPGLTVVDKGLSRIAQERMVKKTLYTAAEEFGVDYKPWFKRAEKKAKDSGYTDVQDRSENIIRPNFREKQKLRKAA